MAKTRSQIEQEFLQAFSDNMANPVNMDKLAVGYHSFMGAMNLVVEDGLAVYDPTQPYGVVWDDNQDTYSRVGHSIPAIQRQMRRVVCNGNPMFGGTLYKYLNSENSSLFEDGSDATSYVTGAAGGNYQVFVEIPKYYYKAYKVGSLNYNIISLTKFDGSKTRDMFKTANWADSGDGSDEAHEVSYGYISAFEGVLYDDSESELVDGTGDNDNTDNIETGADKILSVAGYKPYSGITRDESRLMIVNGASKQFDWHRYEVMVELHLVEFATHDSQSTIAGYTQNTSSPSYTNDVLHTGLTLSLGNNSGSISGSAQHTAGGGDGNFDGVVANSYRGIENFYGHLWQWVDAVNFTDHRPYTCAIVGAFEDDKFDGDYLRTIDADGVEITQPSDNGYQSTLQSGSMFIKSIGASSATKITDYYYQDSGNRVLRSGGRLDDSSLAGVSFLIANDASSNSAWIICCRA